MVILIDHHPHWDWLVKAVEKRLREELAKLKVEINEEKSKTLIWQTEEVSHSWVLNIAASWGVTRSGDPTTRRD
jgi:hypothetical protein